jgi:hypothetical protein
MGTKNRDKSLEDWEHACERSGLSHHYTIAATTMVASPWIEWDGEWERAGRGGAAIDCPMIGEAWQMEIGEASGGGESRRRGHPER